MTFFLPLIFEYNNLWFVYVMNWTIRDYDILLALNIWI